ncbi:hypothetical protein, partial [Desulfovulcanus sp.]
AIRPYLLKILKRGGPNGFFPFCRPEKKLSGQSHFPPGGFLFLRFKVQGMRYKALTPKPLSCEIMIN